MAIESKKMTVDSPTDSKSIYAVGSSSSSIRGRLNPDAMEWDPKRDRSSEEDRCLYLTFLKGSPFSEGELAMFFNLEFGEFHPCVESVQVYQPDGENPPVLGKVVFRYANVPVTVMAGANEVKYTLNDKPLRCKRYHPRRNCN